MLNEAFIRIPSQLGDIPTVTVGNAIIDAHKVINKHTRKVYSDRLQFLSVIFRVDGHRIFWKESGIKRLRYSKQRRYITVDACIQTFEYEDRPTQEIRKLILELINNGLDVCLARIHKEKIQLDEKELKIDLMAAKFEIEASWSVDRTDG